MNHHAAWLARQAQENVTRAYWLMVRRRQRLMLALDRGETARHIARLGRELETAKEAWRDAREARKRVGALDV